MTNITRNHNLGMCAESKDTKKEGHIQWLLIHVGMEFAAMMDNVSFFWLECKSLEMWLSPNSLGVNKAHRLITLCIIDQEDCKMR